MTGNEVRGPNDVIHPMASRFPEPQPDEARSRFPRPAESQSLRDALFWAEANIELHRARGIFRGEEGTLTDAEWLVVLAEEFGEAANALQDGTDEELHAELVQVAAMAARWAGAIPEGRRRVPWAEKFGKREDA